MTSGTTIDTAVVLAAASCHRAEADAAEALVINDALDWAMLHTVDTVDEAATWGDTPVTLAGEGAPWISDFCVPEFALAVGMSHDAGRRMIADALEISHRLPRLWDRVQTGDLQVWRARRIAEQSMVLSPEAADFLDRQVAPYAHRLGIAAVERLVAEAIARHMPETAAEIADRSADQRHLTIDHHQISFSGTSRIHGELDLIDALDLDAVLTAGAAQLADFGCDAHLDARRALALGELSRGQAALALTAQTVVEEVAQRPSRNPEHHPTTAQTVVEEVAQRPSRNPQDHPTTAQTVVEEVAQRPSRNPRQITLYLHLTDEALRSGGIGRAENAGTRLVTADQIRAWCTGANVTVKPVIDLAAQISTTAYEIPDRLREQVILRDQTCVFPWCTRKARSCDLDHITPYDVGGRTSTENLAPLCRRHHRLKTHANWTYETITPDGDGPRPTHGRPVAYLWRSPHGRTYLKDRGLTRDLTPRPVDPPGPPRHPE